MSHFDYNAPAEVYVTYSWSAANKPGTGRRFDRSAEAIRFAIEELSAARSEARHPTTSTRQRAIGMLGFLTSRWLVGLGQKVGAGLLL